MILQEREFLLFTQMIAVYFVWTDSIKNDLTLILLLMLS